MNVISESLTKTQCFAAQFETLKNTINRVGKFGEVPYYHIIVSSNCF